MCFKNKMIAAALCALVAGIGIFGIGNNTAGATATGGTSVGYTVLSVEQLQKIVESLILQIQQLKQMIAELKPLETCGNGICRFGETAASCAADCGASNCIKRGQIISESGTNKCCEGLIPLNGCYVDGVGPDGYAGCSLKPTRCGTLCGNGKCETGLGETAATCPADCGSSACANECAASGERKCEGAGFFQTCGNYDTDSCLEWSALNSCASGQICSGGKCASKVAVCGNYYCETGETAATCPQDCVSTSACAKEGERFDDLYRQCCAGLIKSAYIGPCPSGGGCAAVARWTCDATSCGNGKCETGESASTCSADCQNNTCKTVWWSDNTSKICQQKQFCGSYMYLGLKTYDTQSACQAALDATCSQECMAKGYTLGGNYCVANEYGILDTCCCTGSLRTCGNGVCDANENSANCSRDCYTSASVNFVPVSIVTSSTQPTSVAPATLSNTFNIQVTAKNGDVYLPRNGAFTVAALKDSETDLSQNHIGTVYTQPTGTVVVGNSYKIARDTTVTFSAKATYSTTIAGNYRLQMAVISWSTLDGGAYTNWIPTIPSTWAGQTVYLQGLNSTVCGNGVCETGETQASCPNDCYTSASVEFLPASITTSSTEPSTISKASITGTFNIRVTAKNADAYIPKNGAFTVAVLKDNETDATKFHIGSIYTQPTGAVAMTNSYKIPANTTVTFTPTATYSADTAGSYRLQMFIASWAASDGGMIVNQILTPASNWTTPTVYLKGATALTCNNGYCDNGETASSCPRDCACRIMAFYKEPVAGYAYNNVFLEVKNLPSITPSTPMTLGGVDNWNGLTFALSGANGLNSVLKATQTVNNVGFDYMNARTNNMTITVGNTVCSTSVPTITQVSAKSSPVNISTLSASLANIIAQLKLLMGK
ncbi:MAG: hypothetical protein MUD10_02400 [Candidatus Pacebacteria bacterium]|jgi:hypothetical protein|nr:hypothetical protein [Candidatus Paceibacterota bacterium]